MSNKSDEANENPYQSPNSDVDFRPSDVEFRPTGSGRKLLFLAFLLLSALVVELTFDALLVATTRLSWFNWPSLLLACGVILVAWIKSLVWMKRAMQF
ncbi:MAG: hypothetical protein HYV60_07665 [Planctomycetia bacterium]|nr:hypothetical protein [Planctomycetia bacterium]